MNISSITMPSQGGKDHKRSQITRRLWLNDSYKRKQHDSRIGRTLSIQGRLKLSNKKRELWENPEFRSKMLSIFKSKNFRAKISRKMRGRKLSEETKNKISFS